MTLQQIQFTCLPKGYFGLFKRNLSVNQAKQFRCYFFIVMNGKQFSADVWVGFMPFVLHELRVALNTFYHLLYHVVKITAD